MSTEVKDIVDSSGDGLVVSEEPEKRGQLWQFVDLFFRTQTPQAPSDSHVTKLLDASPGIDIDRVLADADKNKVLKQIEKTDEDAERYELTQTPSLLVSKHKITPKLLEIKDSWTAKDLLSAIGRRIG